MSSLRDSVLFLLAFPGLTSWANLCRSCGAGPEKMPCRNEFHNNHTREHETQTIGPQEKAPGESTARHFPAACESRAPSQKLFMRQALDRDQA